MASKTQTELSVEISAIDERYRARVLVVEVVFQAILDMPVDGFKVLLEEPLVRRRSLDSGENRFKIVFTLERLAREREEPAEISVGRLRIHEKRVQQQMVQHIVAANVHDERPARTKLPDVVKVLLGSDTDIDPSHRFEVFDHLGVRCFVGDEIVGVEISALFGELLDELAKARGRRGVSRARGEQADEKRKNACPPPKIPHPIRCDRGPLASPRCS